MPHVIRIRGITILSKIFYLFFLNYTDINNLSAVISTKNYFVIEKIIMTFSDQKTYFFIKTKIEPFFGF